MTLHVGRSIFQAVWACHEQGRELLRVAGRQVPGGLVGWADQQVVYSEVNRTTTTAGARPYKYNYCCY
jgi:hypothetical protein